MIQDYPLDYNYANEQDRFGQAGRLWQQAAPPGSEHWNAVMDELLELDFTLTPTLTIYEASRDLMRVRRAEWHEQYTLPSLWRWFEPNRDAHGSYWFYWSTEDEVAWKENYRLWMAFLNEYKNRGGRVTTGSDSGYIYKTYGFGYIRELELLREAGFHPLEVIRSATLLGAEALGQADSIGSVEPGKLADLVIVEENPLENLKVLYGTGAIKVTKTTRPCGSAASSTPSRTASSSTPNSSWPTYVRWSRRPKRKRASFSPNPECRKTQSRWRLSRIRIRQDLGRLRSPKGVQRLTDLRVPTGQNRRGKQRRVDRAGLAHREGSYRDSRWHLDHGKQRVDSLQLRLHRHSQHGFGGLGRHHASQVSRATGSSDEDLRSARLGLRHVGGQSLGGSMCR